MGRSGFFWEALHRCAESGDGAIEKKAGQFAANIARWRRLSRHTSLAQRLETIVEETGYEDWIAAQDRGEQRRANVRRVIDLARQFDAARGEGLYPFLQYVEDQTKAIGDIAPAPVNSQGAVRLTTVHQSKGLQFPIVIMAGLTKKFNTEDLRGIELLDAEYGLCLKARPPKTRRQYETLPFWMARHRRHKQMLDEEMRILYVALTRAEQRMLLVGAPPKNAREHWSNGVRRATAATCMLDWIGPWLARDCPDVLSAQRGQADDWIWQWHSRVETPTQAITEMSAPEIPPDALARIKQRIEWQYGFLAATQQEAKSSATALRRGLSDEPELAAPVVRAANRSKDSLAGNEIGQATHRLIQHARFDAFDSIDELTSELKALEGKQILKSTEAAAVDVAKIAGFWKTDFGRELFSVRDRIEREVVFTAKFSRADLIAAGAPVKADFGDQDFIVVQGAADLVAELEEELWLVDFKTDRIPQQLVAARVNEYTLQLRIYALALSRIYRKPVTRACLHFLEVDRTEWIDL
jgi:ATP-dependent helicase/nuclease subunit A